MASSEIDLVINDPETGNRIIRNSETNLGDLCADAYREKLGADIAFVNGGGIRADIKKGDITFGDVVAVHPYGNEACMIEVTGQQILDALEWASRSNPGENGGFLQVSGLTYEIHNYIESPCVADDKSGFDHITDGERRVKNVKVGGTVIDPEKKYTLGGSGGGTPSYAVKFEANGAKTIKSQLIIRNGTVKEPVQPEKNGYKFAGWYLDKELTQAYDFSTAVTKGFTLYAKWVEVKNENPDLPNKADKPEEPKIAFADVKENDWFYNAVKFVFEIASGVSETVFAPNDKVTRGQFITMLCRACTNNL